MKYIQPITKIYHVTEPLMDTVNVSAGAGLKGIMQTATKLGNQYAR